MGLTLVTNPVGSGSVKLFAGFDEVKFIFKREDLEIDSVESGSGGIKLNVSSDLTSYLSAGDSVYVYAEGDNYTYDGVGTVLSLTSGDITLDIAYIEDATGGYINYLKNYYVELQCVDETFASSNKLPFNLTSDGDAAGNIEIDVSIVNDLNKQRGVYADGLITESKQEFEVQYRQVYEGSSESYTLVDSKLVVLLYATDTPETETILNSFDIPKIYLGYEAALVLAKEADPASSTQKLTYKELDVNQQEIADGELSELDSDVNGFLMWKIASDISLEDTTKYLLFDFDVNVLADYDSDDYDSDDYATD